MKMLFKFILIFTGGFIRGLNCQTSQNINVCKYPNYSLLSPNHLRRRCRCEGSNWELIEFKNYFSINEYDYQSIKVLFYSFASGV